MQWSEFSSLLAGLNENTPLGKMIYIRSETDKDKLKLFSPEQRRIRNEWMAKIAKKQIENDPEGVRKQINSLHSMFKQAFGGGGSNG